MEAIRKLEMKGNIKLVIAFVVLNILDAALTVIAADRGTLCEVNPLMRYVLEQPRWMLWAIKINAILLCTLVLLLLSAKYPRQIRRILIILIGVMTGICVINLIGVM